MRRLKASIFILVFSLAHFSSASAEDRFLCISDVASGVAFNKNPGRWVGTTFMAGSKFILRRIAPSEDRMPAADRGKWAVLTFGQEMPLTLCGDEAWHNGIFACDDFEDFLFSRETLRFQYIYKYGYVHGDGIQDSDADTPAISIGVCSPF